jgi:hypothetical protein
VSRKGKGPAKGEKTPTAIIHRRSGRKRNGGGGQDGGARPQNEGFTNDSESATPATLAADGEEEFTMAATGRDESDDRMLRQKGLQGVQTPENLKSKRAA